MKKYIALVISIVCICTACICIKVFAEGGKSNLVLESVSVKKDSVRAYFNIADENGNFNSSNIDKNNITADISGEKLKLNDFKRFENINEGTTYVLMADVSGSMGASGRDNTEKLFSEIVNKMGDKDKAAFVTFGNSEKVLQDFTADKSALTNKINVIDTKEDNTDLYRAITKSMDMLSKNENLTAKRVIIILSDGEECNEQGITKDEVLIRIKESHIPIFSIAFKSSDDKNIKESMKILGSFARLSMGQDFVLGDGSKTTTDITDYILSRIKKSYVADFESTAVKMEGQNFNFNISIKLDDKNSIAASQSIILPVAPSTAVSAPSSVATPKPTKIPFYRNSYAIVAAVGILVLLVVSMVVVSRKKKKPTTENVEDNNSFSEEEIKDIDSSASFSNPKKEESQFSKGIKVRLMKLGKNKEEAYEFMLEDSVVIGRDSSKSKVVFEKDEMLSGSHCEFTLENGMVFVCDLESTNGTFVNGVPITGLYRLFSDDILLIGSMEFRVLLDEDSDLDKGDLYGGNL